MKRPLSFLLPSLQLLESPRTRLLHQLQRMRQQEEQEEEVFAALRSASKAGTTALQEEGQPSLDDGEPVVPGKIIASRSQPQ